MADKTLMELEPPPEQVSEYRKQAKPRVEKALSPVCQLAPHTGNRHGQQDEPSRRTAADDCSGTEGPRDSGRFSGIKGLALCFLPERKRR